MNLDEMKLAWHAMDQRLANIERLTLQRARDGKTERMRRGLRPLTGGAIASMLIGLLGALWAAPYWIAHRGELALLLSGLALHAYCIGLIVFGVVMLVQISRIDYAAPVLAIQHQLQRLRRTYVIGGVSLGLPWWFLYVPLLVIGTGGDIIHNAPLVVWSQLAVGVAGVIGMVGFYRWSHCAARLSLGRRVDDGMAGASIRRAQNQAEELVRFERE